MRRFLLVFNYVVLFVSIGAWFYAASIASAGGVERVTEIDNHGGFNGDRIRTWNPELAGNLRHNVAQWIQEPERNAAVAFSFVMGVIGIMNFAGLHLLGRKDKRTGDPASAPDA